MTCILFWNCRGASKLSSRAYLQELVRTHRPIAVALLETRRQSFSRRDIDRLIGRDWSFEHIPSSGKSGNSGGIILLWLNDIIKVNIISKNKQFLLASITTPLGSLWHLGAIYASKYKHRRRIIWDEMSKLDNTIPTILGGDFNCILREEEKRGGSPFCASKGPLEFANFISSNNLHEVQFTGNIFTWNNNQDCATRLISRLDRVLLNSEACMAFPGSIAHHLTRIGSDHSPVLLELDKLKFNSHKSRLRFEEAWMTNPDVHSVAYGAWSKPVSGCPSKILALKSARTIKTLARWSKFNAKKETFEAKKLEEEINKLQLREAERPLLVEELLSLRVLVAKYNEIQVKLDVWWWQRAKRCWLEHGDRNSAFFQAAATQRKYENRIFSLLINDEVITDQARLEQELVSHFSLRWCLEDQTTSVNLPAPAKVLSDEEGDWIQLPITDREIKDAVFSFKRNRAPGNDGVTHSFYSYFWEFTKTEISAAIKDFFNSCKMEESWKDTLVMLIPKNNQASLPEHYRPISLCTSIYKVVAKIITNRIKPLLPKLISEEQSAFVPGRVMSDNCMLAQELLHRLHTTESNAGQMAVKIDMEKAFDRIQWSFVRRALEAFRFPHTWINLIMECISAPRFGLLINGKKADWISASCGLRQGCPLSPYLFIMCSEFLSILIRQSLHPGIGIKVCASAPKISHLLFADDTLLLGSATLSTAKEFARILQTYCSLTGEAVNASKSNVIFGPKVNKNSKDAILSMLGHSDAKAFKYLGIVLRPGKVLVGDFDDLLDKIARMIRSWGARHLSMAGRVALINSTLTAIPSHVLANTPVPQSVLNKIDSLLKNFLWSGSKNTHSIHYAQWDDLCVPRELGGLGIKNLGTWRNVIMAKMARRVRCADGSLAARILGSKYSGPAMFTRARNHSKIWKAISLGGDVVAKHTFWMVGNGANINTLNDTWIGQLSIAKWPTFVDINLIPNQVAGLLHVNGDWSDCIYIIFGQSLADLIKQLPRNNIGGADSLVWAHTETECINAAAIYKEESWTPALIGGEIWKYKAQPRMLMVVWRALNDMLPSYDWLHRHHLREDDRCPWGCDEPETTMHMFGECRFINKLWAESQRLNLKLKPSNGQPLSLLCKDVKANRNSLEAKCLISIIYNTWKARNNMIHGKNYLQPAAIITNVIQEASCGSWKVQCNHQASWTTPPTNWIKINFDGSVHENNIAGLGCVIRNHNGECIAAKGSRIASRSINMTELRSAQAGLVLAKPFFESKQGVILEGDSADACKRLKNILTQPSLDDVDLCIARLLKDAPRIEISQIDRKANGAADYIANLACEGDFCWERGMPLPQMFSDLLKLDLVSM